MCTETLHVPLPICTPPLHHMSSQRIHLDPITLLKSGWQYKYHDTVYYAESPALNYLSV